MMTFTVTIQQVGDDGEMEVIQTPDFAEANELEQGLGLIMQPILARAVELTIRIAPGAQHLGMGAGDNLDEAKRDMRQRNLAKNAPNN